MLLFGMWSTSGHVDEGRNYTVFLLLAEHPKRYGTGSTTTSLHVISDVPCSAWSKKAMTGLIGYDPTY